MSYSEDTWDAEASEWAEENFKDGVISEWFEVLQKKMEQVKKARIGEKVNCTCCPRTFIKKTKHHAFCSASGKGNCKDRYWNTIRVGEKP